MRGLPRGWLFKGVWSGGGGSERDRESGFSGGSSGGGRGGQRAGGSEGRGGAGRGQARPGGSACCNCPRAPPPPPSPRSRAEPRPRVNPSRRTGASRRASGRRRRREGPDARTWPRRPPWRTAAPLGARRWRPLFPGRAVAAQGPESIFKALLGLQARVRAARMMRAR